MARRNRQESNEESRGDVVPEHDAGTPQTDEQNQSASTESEDTGEETKETPAERFTRLAAARTSRIIPLIRLLGNLAGKPKLYQFTPEQVDKMFTVLNGEIAKSRQRYDDAIAGKEPEQTDFFSF